MWFVTHLIAVAAICLSLFQISTPAREAQSSPSRKPGPNSADAASREPAAAVPATTTVITIRGLCAEGTPKPSTDEKLCARRMPRQQFEPLMKALNPDSRAIPPAARRNVAKTYTEFLAIEAALRNEGLEDTPEFRALLEWTRLRAMADFYRHHLEEKYRTPSPGEIDAYYHQHLADYERVGLARILVPRENPSAPNKEDKDRFDKKALMAAQTAQSRAARGEDPAQLQNDAYAAVGLVAPPPTNLGSRRRAEMVAEEAAVVFALGAGEVGPVETELKSYVIYKVIGKDTVPLEEVTAEIAREIYRQKFRDSMKSVLDAFPGEFNEQYFVPETAAPSPKPPVNPASSPVH